MVAKFEQYIRWDFLGLSTDTKPTPATSENVTDGSTFFEVDTSKLYVWCQDNWYEKEDTGGGGGGDTPVIKPLTNDDLNYPTNNPSRIALCDLPNGLYYRDRSMSKAVNASHGTTANEQLSSSPMEYAAVVHESDTDVSIYFYRVTGDKHFYVTNGVISNYEQSPRGVADNLTTNNAQYALSAKQGKVLDEKINVVALPLTLNEATGDLTSQQTCGQIKSLMDEGKIFIPYVTLTDTSLVEGGIVVITRENTGGTMVIYLFDGDSAQFILINLAAATDNDYFTGSLPS